MGGNGLTGFVAWWFYLVTVLAFNEAAYCRSPESENGSLELIEALKGLPVVGRDVSGSSQAVKEELWGNRPSVVIFFTSNCGFCKAEIPIYASNRGRLENHCGYRILTVSLDRDRKTLERTIKEWDITFPVIHDFKEAVVKWGIRKVPTVFFFNTNGRVIQKHVGSGQTEQVIQQLMSHQLCAKKD
ncbi:MAG: TlpA family protein disulfide reductase [Bdellovibrionaceae bacterium]|nr:TlpA family protein disulfide reductase [Pseudobdellovibrionaceae bacterium]MDW8190777.1 TlpA disulfide reductase family protein [Pseudobdellovibrionaceae bacterium]